MSDHCVNMSDHSDLLSQVKGHNLLVKRLIHLHLGSL